VLESLLCLSEGLGGVSVFLVRLVFSGEVCTFACIIFDRFFRLCELVFEFIGLWWGFV